MAIAMMWALILEMGAAILTCTLTWRAARGTLGRNALAGVRTPVTMSSDAAWQTAHRGALRPMLITGFLTVVGCVVCIATDPLRHPVAVLVAASVLVGGSLWSVAAAHRAVRRSRVEHPPSDGKEPR